MVSFRPDHPKGRQNPWFSALGGRRVFPTYSRWEFSWAISLFPSCMCVSIVTLLTILLRSCIHTRWHLFHSLTCHENSNTIPGEKSKIMKFYRLLRGIHGYFLRCFVSGSIVYNLKVAQALGPTGLPFHYKRRRATAMNLDNAAWYWEKICSINNNRVSTRQRKISYPTVFRKNMLIITVWLFLLNPSIRIPSNNEQLYITVCHETTRTLLIKDRSVIL